MIIVLKNERGCKKLKAVCLCLRQEINTDTLLCQEAREPFKTIIQILSKGAGAGMNGLLLAAYRTM